MAETADCIYMLDTNARNDMQDTEVQAKKDVAVQWCRHAAGHAVTHGGKPWKYLLIPHGAISENATLLGLVNQYHID